MEEFDTIEKEERMLSKWLLVTLAAATMYGIGILNGIYLQNARITDEINRTEMRILEQQGRKTFTAPPPNQI